MSNKIIHADATKLAELIRSKEVFPVEVVQAHLDRTTAADPKINAVVTLADGALKAAKAAEAAVLSGEELGPLHGEEFDRHRWRDDPARLQACYDMEPETPAS